MEDIKEKKQAIRDEVLRKYSELSAETLKQKIRAIESRLFEFANFLESKITLLYLNQMCEMFTHNIIRICLKSRKMIVLPVFAEDEKGFKLLKVDDLEKDILETPEGILTPDPKRCKEVPVDCIDIAIIPGIAFDEKGGRIGPGDAHYDRLIPELPVTTRKVSLAYEEQIVNLVPMESHDKHVDIIITDKRVIYKI